MPCNRRAKERARNMDPASNPALANRFERLHAMPAYRMVAKAIQDEIESSRLRPGELLPTETVLASQFGVNRSTIREGIRLLENSGLLERRDGKRLVVTLPHYMDLASRASRALVMHQVTFRELWEASMASEPLVAGLAAERADAINLAAMERNVAASAAASQRLEHFIDLDIEFHNLVAQASGNRVLMLAREPIGLLFKPAGETILPRLGTHQRVVDAHRHILEAIGRGDRDTAQRWMERHMADFRRGYEAAGQDLDRPLYA
jgi:DNA-binding FadR family transcriptional regulator